MPERKVTISATAPSSPNTGDGWIHPTTRIEKIWNGTSWEPVLANLTQAKIWVGNASGKPTEENKPAGGTDTKSGTKAAVAGSNSVTFNTPFASTPRVALTVQDNIALRDCIYQVTAVSKTGFSFDADIAATYAWIATDAGNS